MGDVQEKLVEWFLSHGGSIHPSITLSKDDKSGQHFRASKDLRVAVRSELQVCMCPFKLTLSHLNLYSFPPAGLHSEVDESICTKLVGKVPTAALSCFFLVEQRLKGPQSFWAPYICALPKEEDLHTPLWFEEDDLKFLLGTTIHVAADPGRSGVEMRRGMWKEQYEQGIKVLENGGDSSHKFTWNMYLWAATIFTSRGFTSNITMAADDGIDSFSLLYPAIDSFNHRFGAKAVWNLEQGDFALVLAESIKKGEEIYNNYAPKGNQELLMGYGFCVTGNPCDEVAIRLGCPPPQVQAALQERFPNRYMSPEWDPEAATFFLRGTKHYSGGYENGLPCLRGLPSDFYGTIRTILYFAFQAQGQEDGVEISDEELTEASLQAIHDRLLDKRNAIVQWNPQLPPKARNIRQVHAKIYRDGQLEILDEIISELQDHLEAS